MTLWTIPAKISYFLILYPEQVFSVAFLNKPVQKVVYLRFIKGEYPSVEEATRPSGTVLAPFTNKQTKIAMSFYSPCLISVVSCPTPVLFES